MIAKKSRSEAGRLGGLATSRKHGRAHMQAIGRAGGRATVERHGRPHLSEIGKRGYSTMCQRYFAGDRAAQRAWFVARGLFVQDAYPANGAFPDPGPFPEALEFCGPCDLWTNAPRCPRCGRYPAPF